MNFWFVVSLVLILLTAGCGRKIYVLPKETRVTEKPISNPDPRVKYDRFYYQQASGKLDIVFVGDNSGPGSLVLEDFKSIQSKLLERLHEENLRRVDYSLISASGPSIKVSRSFIIPDRRLHGALKACHNYELYGPSDPINNPCLDLERDLKTDVLAESIEAEIMSRRELANPVRVIETSIKALEHPFLSSEKSMLIYVYLLSSIHADETSFNRMQLFNLSEKFRQYREDQKYVFMMSRDTPEVTPLCVEQNVFFRSIGDFIQNLKSLVFSDRVQTYNLCDAPNEIERMIDEMEEEIKKQKSRMILSFKPERPELMRVKIGTMDLEFGVDYSYDELNNEIVILNPYDLKKGDLIEVIYAIELTEGVGGEGGL